MVALSCPCLKGSFDNIILDHPSANDWITGLRWGKNYGNGRASWSSYTLAGGYMPRLSMDVITCAHHR